MGRFFLILLGAIGGIVAYLMLPFVVTPIFAEEPNLFWAAIWAAGGAMIAAMLTEE